MRKVKHIHFIGIGGSGMGGIAEVLLREDYKVSGSDVAANAMTLRLRELGATVYPQHAAHHIRGADVVVVSSAITPSNPEYQAAQQKRIPIVPRAEMLAELMRFREGVAIAGTHGKTTTTSLTASLLAEGELDPTFVIGGKLTSMGTHAQLGGGRHLVVEADESDASFLHLQPMLSVVTNIDADHLENYEGDFSKLRAAFLQFLHQLPFYGQAILCIDDTVVRELLPQVARPVLTYGFSSSADIRALNFQPKGFQSYFEVKRAGRNTLPVVLNLPGRHNVLNALAAIAVAQEAGVSDEAIVKALKEFKGIARRLQQLGDLALPQGGQATLIDDYGHHPREIAATLAAVKQVWPDRRLVMAFQPHRYTRTRDLFNEFLLVLSQVDALVLLPVYAASEAVLPGAESQDLCVALQAQVNTQPVFVGNPASLPSVLSDILEPNDVVLMQGAGDIAGLSARLVSEGLPGTVSA